MITLALERTAALERPPPCILIVDDEELVRETLREVVEMTGCSAACAANGAEALQFLSQTKACLVILDLKMPVMSGEEFLEAVSQEPSLASVPVVISTSAPDHAPAGFSVIPKPIDINIVFSWVRRCCSCAPRSRTTSRTSSPAL
jgi:two-component system, sensor histidine kinase